MFQQGTAVALACTAVLGCVTARFGDDDGGATSAATTEDRSGGDIGSGDTRSTVSIEMVDYGYERRARSGVASRRPTRGRDPHGRLRPVQGGRGVRQVVDVFSAMDGPPEEGEGDPFEELFEREVSAPGHILFLANRSR
ncbi:MAG TPA: hypothetical protein VGR26_13905 [Acidimicrobiales bacterium]|nr:hypothetical protein [Acidimicrobiales bacterium]